MAVLLSSIGDFLGYCGGGETSAETLLPYRDHVRDGIVQLTDGSLLAMYRCAGIPYALQSNRERNAHIIHHVAFCHAVAEDNVEINEYLIKHKNIQAATPRPKEHSEYAVELLHDYVADLTPRLRTIEWFVAILVKPRKRWIDSVPGQERRRLWEDPQQLLVQLDEACRLFEVIMKDVRPIRLGRRIEDEIQFSEIIEAILLLATARHGKIPLVDEAGQLGDSLYTHETICGTRGFEIRHSPYGTDSTWGLMTGLKTYPRQFDMAKFDDILRLDGSFVLMNTLVFQTRAEAQDALDLLRKYMVQTNDPSALDREALEDAIGSVAAGRMERGWGRWSMALHGDTQAECDKLLSNVKNIMANAGGKPTHEGLGCYAAYWAQFPGCREKLRIRLGQFSAAQFATLSSLCGFPRGPDKPRWGSYGLRFATIASTALEWDIFVGDVGHLPIVAPNGAGKTVIVGQILAAYNAIIREKGGSQILIDVDASNANTILALGGSYTFIPAGEDSGVVPLLLPNTPRVRLMLREFIAALAQWDDGDKLTPAERRGLADGVDFVMSEVPPEERHLGIVRRFMGYEDGGAGERLEAWCREHEGEHAWAFDGRKHTLDFNVPLAGVDITNVMNDKHVMPPMAMFILWMASDVMDGRRCMVVAEEAPAYMPEPRFSRIFKGIALRARKRNTCFIPIAQMPEDLLATDAGKAIIKQARQILALPNDKADEHIYRIEMGFTEKEFWWVRQGMLELPYRAFLAKRSDGQGAVLRYDLSSLPHHIPVLSSFPKSVELLRDCIRTHGNKASAFLPEFRRRFHEVTV